MTFSLKIREKKSPHAMEREKRYSVLLNDAEVGELYFNTTGYRGSLMTVHGDRFDIGEKGLSAWIMAARHLNHEAKQVLLENAKDPAKLIRSEPTVSGDYINLAFSHCMTHNEIEVAVPKQQFRAGCELIGGENLTTSYFKDSCETQKEPLVDYVPSGEGSVLRCLSTYRTSDPDIMAAVLGENGAPVSVFFGQRETIETIQSVTGLENFEASLLPGGGVTSEPKKIFSKSVALTSQRPDILIVKDDELYAGFIEAQGYKAIWVEDDLEVEADEEQNFAI